MSTPQPPTRDQAPADPNRPWLQQTDAPAPSASQPQQQQPQQQPPQTPPPPPHHLPPGPNAAAQPSFSDAVSTIKPADFLTFHQAPCARAGLLTGIGAGAAVGALRWIMGLPIPRAANWAVGTGTLAAVLEYEYCQLKRRQEREKVKRVVEVYAAKQVREREEEAARRRERERVEREEGEKKKGWWRFW